MRIISQWQRLVNLQIAIALFTNGILAHCPSVLAQIKPDNTLGQENSVINKVDNVKDLITGGASRGANLFHSFENFNVGTGRSVYFANPGGIENILTRVTGGNASNILGKLGVEGTANLFLINPHGIYFGKDASLDIKGSFIATTADEIQLGESGLFSATEPAKSNLLNIQPGALFANAIKNHQTKIENQANLITGKDLKFFSSNINSSGVLSAPHGQIELAATGNIQVNQLTAQAARLTANQNINYGNISIVADDNTTNSSINPILSLTAGNQITGTGNITTTAPRLLVNLQAEDNINLKNISSKGGDINITSEGGDIITGKLDTTYATSPQTTIIDIDEGGTFTINPYEYIYSGEFTFNSNLTDPITEVKVRLSVSNVLSNSAVRLSSHTGDVYLIDPTGNNLANFQDTLLADSASTSISSGSTPFNGTFQPSQPLANLNRRNPNGTWYLTIYSDEDNNLANTATTVYKAGDIAPWGIATGTQLIITTARSLGAGGNINLKAGGNISTGDINSSSSVNAGLINLNANHHITTGNINSSSILGSGGNIALITNKGNITTANLDSSSFSDSGIAGNGGGMTLSAGGDITTANLDSSSFSDSGIAGNGGGMTLSADGNITTQNLNSSSSSDSGTAGNGGGMTLSAGDDISTQSLSSYSSSDSGTAGNGGGMTLSAGDDISTQSLSSYSFSDSGNAGNGGGMTLSAGGDISTQSLSSSSSSDSGTAENGGGMTLNAGDDITTANLDSSSSSSSFSGTGGNGGGITLTAGGDITTEYLNSRSSSSSFSGTGGNGGRITLTAGGDIDTLSLNSFSFPSSFSFSGTGGNGGRITLTAGGDIDTESLSSYSFSVSGNAGNGGVMTLTAGGDITTESLSSYSSSYSGTAGNGGGITLIAGGDIITTANLDSSSSSASGTEGNGGGITLTAGDDITTESLSSYSSSYSGTAGNGGGMTLTAGGDIESQSLDSHSYSFSGTAGNGGGISLSSGGDIKGITDESIQEIPIFSSFSVSETGNSGQGGNIVLAAKNNITNLEILTLSSSSKSGDVQIQGFGDLSLTNTGIITSKQVSIKLVGREIPLDVGGVGQSGNVKIDSTGNLTFNNTRIESDTKGNNPAGNVNIISPGIVTFNNSKIISNTSSQGKAGSIQIDAKELTLTGASQISASTSRSGKSGSINLNIRDNITLTGKNTGLFANTRPGSTGDSGNITIDPQTFIIKNGAGIGVNSQGSGKGGNISIEAGNLNLDQGFITAETTSNQGGDINLNIQDLLLMRNNSRITASAGTNQTGGDGGNININSPLIVAMPDENNDITANAFQGKGGNINITANEIFGLEFRPQQTAKSDITASSELGVSGNVQINTPGVDPASGIGELPAILVDAESLVARNICDATVIRESSFVMTGKGGLPADSQDVIANAPGLVEWVSRGDNENKVSVVVKPQQQTDNFQPINQKVIQQAQGWIVTANGQVILTAEVPKTTLQKPHFLPPSCGETTR
jgi:filamentous hemagglutinin family protein